MLALVLGSVLAVLALGYVLTPLLRGSVAALPESYAPELPPEAVPVPAAEPLPAAVLPLAAVPLAAPDPFAMIPASAHAAAFCGMPHAATLCRPSGSVNL